MQIRPINNIYNHSFSACPVVTSKKGKVEIDLSQLTEEELKILNDRKLMLTLDELGLLQSKVYHAYKKYFPGKVEIKPLSEYAPVEKPKPEPEPAPAPIHRQTVVIDEDADYWRSDPFAFPRPYSEL